MKTKNRSRLAAMVLSAMAVLGIGGAALAQSDAAATTQPQSSAPADPAQEANEPVEGNEATEAQEPNEANEVNEVEEESPSYTGSITAPDDNKADGVETADDEAVEAEALAKLATVTPQQAEKAALGEVPGTVLKVELGNENGFVVYEVEIDTGSGVVEVKVDAGNGKILHQEADNETEAAEASS